METSLTGAATNRDHSARPLGDSRRPTAACVPETTDGQTAQMVIRSEAPPVGRSVPALRYCCLIKADNISLSFHTLTEEARGAYRSRCSDFRIEAIKPARAVAAVGLVYRSAAEW